MERRGEEMMVKMAAFQQSRIILTGAELDVFTRLDEAASSAAALSKDLGCDGRAMGRLLDALASLGLLKKEGSLFSLSGQGKLLSSRHPETILPMILHLSELWEKWSGLTGVVRTGKPVKGAAGGERGEANRRAFIGAMHAVGRNLAAEISRAFDAGRFRRLLDIGGGSGTYTIAFLRRNPAMTAVLFDLASVIPMASERLRAERLADRVTLVAGDFSIRRAPLPGAISPCSPPSFTKTALPGTSTSSVRFFAPFSRAAAYSSAITSWTNRIRCLTPALFLPSTCWSAPPEGTPTPSGRSRRVWNRQDSPWFP